MKDSTSLKILDFPMVEEIDDDSAEAISGGFKPVPVVPVVPVIPVVPLLLPMIELELDLMFSKDISKKCMPEKPMPEKPMHKKKEPYH